MYQLKWQGLLSNLSNVLNRFLLIFSSEKLLPDRLFYMGFYLCLALLPPLIGILGFKAVFVPFLIISSLVVLRFFMYPECQKIMLPYFKTPTFFLLLIFALLLLVHAAIDISSGRGTLSMITKPFIVLLIAILLSFVWSHEHLINKKLFFQLTVIGFWTGLIVTLLKIIVIKFWERYLSHDIPVLTSFLHIDSAINRELVILSIFCFIVFWNIRPDTRRHTFLFGLLFFLLVTSFYTIGFYGKSIGIVQSETMQFGILASLLVLILSIKRREWMINIIFAGISFVLLTAPWLYQLSYRLIEQQASILPKATKFLVRSEIWDGVAQKVLESPFFGFGIQSITRLNHIDLANKYMPSDTLSHSHNMVLELWHDLGLMGVLIILGLLFLSWRSIWQSDSSLIPAILSVIVMIFSIMIVSHSIWQTWSMAILTNVFIVISLYMKMSPDQKV